MSFMTEFNLAYRGAVAASLACGAWGQRAGCWDAPNQIRVSRIS